MNPELLTGMAAFETLADEWDDLAGRSMTDTPFQTVAYQRAWWRHLGPGDLYVISLRNEDGRLAAIAPFFLLEGTLYFNGCVEESDYLDLIAPAEQALSAWIAIFDYLESDLFPTWTALDLCNVPAASPTRAILPQLAQERGFTFETAVHEVCPVIELGATFDDYLNQLDGKQRHEIRRKLRKADGAGMVVTTVTAADDLNTAVDTFLNLLQKSTSQKNEWLNDGRRAVFHEVAAEAMAREHLQLMFVTLDGREAAALFNFSYKGRTWVYNSGLDPEAFGWLSPGVVLTARAIEQAIESGHQCFDFLRGNETYKYRFGANDTTIHRLCVGRGAEEVGS